MGVRNRSFFNFFMYRKINNPQSGSIKTSIIGLVALASFTVFYYYYDQLPKCNSKSTLDTLQVLLKTDRFADIKGKYYNSNIVIASADKIFRKSDSVVCNANIKIEVAPNTAIQINDLFKAPDRKSIIEKNPELEFIFTQGSWLPSENSFSTKITYEVSNNEVSIGGDGGMLTALRYAGLQEAIMALGRINLNDKSTQLSPIEKFNIPADGFLNINEDQFKTILKIKDVDDFNNDEVMKSAGWSNVECKPKDIDYSSSTGLSCYSSKGFFMIVEYVGAGPNAGQFISASLRK